MRRKTVLLLLYLCSMVAVAAAPTDTAPTRVTPRLQTEASLQDAASDVAIWIHPTDPARSLVLGAGGTAGLETFDLRGALVQRFDSLEATFVDVRYAVAAGGSAVDVALVLDAAKARLHMLAIDAETRQLRKLAAAPLALGTEATGLCSYRSGITGKLYAVVATDEGDLQQWELHARDDGAISGTLIRRVPVGRGAGHCAVDDPTQQIYVAVETTGLWRIAAEPESDATPVQLDALEPLGTLREEVKGTALYRVGDDVAYLLALDVGRAALAVYDLDGKRLGSMALAATGEIPPVEEPEGLAIAAGGLPGFEGGLLVATDEVNGDAYANYKLVAWRDVAVPLGLASRSAPLGRAVAPPSASTVVPSVETEPVTTHGDAADDPAIWVHPDDPAASLVIGTNKESGLEVYDLDGRRLQILPDGRMNNVDIRDGFPYRGARVSLVAVTNRTTKTIALYRVDVATRRLEALETGDMTTDMHDPYGLCLFHDRRRDRFYVIINDADSGLLRQWRLEERGGRVIATRVRDIEVGSQSEGCVADDELGHLYVGEEDVAIWKYGADPRAGSRRTAVDTVEAGRLIDDIEGLGLYEGPNGTGYLVASSQGDDTYGVYRREGNNAWVGKFHVVANEESGIDGASETDGLDVSSAALGPQLPQGLLVVQDGRNLMPKDRQNFKFVSWQDIAKALHLDAGADSR
jgi:3-phytase